MKMLKAVSNFKGQALPHLVQQHIGAGNLRTSEIFLDRIFRHKLDFICIVNEQRKITYLSPSVKSLLGYSAEQIRTHAGIGIYLVHPDDCKMVLSLMDSLLSADGFGQLECRIRHQQNFYIRMKVIGHSLTKAVNGSREVILACYVLERRRIAQEIEERAEYLNTLIDTMSQLLFTYDSKLRITFMNKRCSDYLGYDPDITMGKCIWELFPEKHQSGVFTEALNCLIKGNSGQYETIMKRKDGSWLPVRLLSFPIIKNGIIIGGLVVCEDITEQFKIQQEMARLAQLHMVGEIAAGIGHEIRNPMTTVQGFLQMLSQNEELSKYHNYFQLMLEELERANGIINEFLSLARNKVVNYQRINLNHVLNSMYPLLQANAVIDDKQVCFIPGIIEDLLLDEKEIRQLILNLVCNGLEAMPAGGKVTITTEQLNDKVRLSIQDEGSGIDLSILDKIGTPFFTTKDKGTGLGLAVCFRIIARHKATVDIQTGPQGTTFCIDFKVNRNYHLKTGYDE